MALVLRKSGYDVTVAATKMEAIQLCQYHTFDLLIGDIELPDGNGNDLMREIAAKCKIKGIAYTGYDDEKLVGDALAAGYTRCLVKPVTLSVLLTAVEQLLKEPPE
jgi:CheY-like chemotaxis protein